MDFWTGADPVRRADLLAAGVSGVEIRRALADRELIRLRRGVYLPAGPDGNVPAVTERAARHAVAVRGALCRLEPSVVVSHVSAAVLHGLDPWGIPLRRVHVTRARRTGGRVGADLHLHSAALEPDEIEVLDGVSVTSVPRTVADLARTVPFDRAVAVADAALRLPGVTPEDLCRAVGRGRRRPGNAAAERVIRFADGRSESAGESRSRVTIHRIGLPTPDLQRDVHDADGEWLARVDFWWDGDPPVVGEFDGEVKYGRMLRPGQSPGEVVFEEKRREDALRREGLGVARWTWSEIDDFATTAAHLRRLLD
ncbi:putative AbiEi antitoxin of type IV toxin-antitoxin system [Pseudonocardia sediminis]|uniref:Putative AbiEi antitoxin of type IV toxin-antitoxin system n=1 Tax=Pseudonocardia sediminis TaxID=1397368 RepID=A0A4Q7UVA9_PSEST|nr:type IV toxin-antitoxin system AbiEi family antitoxin domain-containing protein [Pseudonocardia sediminis]RZT84003.1 putative AbiEi antitoxin of type IV toxin-antitoxin system [Pseudonocardia sediminis]